jgi:hypothetical protein
VNAFCTALKERFTDRTSGLGKAYLRLHLGDGVGIDLGSGSEDDPACGGGVEHAVVAAKRER